MLTPPAKFSVVTISFNQSAYLEQAILSVVSQGHAPVEYIVVDSGSTDGSREIVERHRDRISQRVFEPDAGPADGLNKGFARATGDIFCYINADDAFLPDAFRHVAQVFESRPDVDVVLGDGLLWNAEGSPMRRIYSRPFWKAAAAYGGVTYVQPATFFRASAFRRTPGFNVGNRICWDIELLAELALAGARFHYEPALLGAYRRHSGSLTQSREYAERRAAQQIHLAKRVLGRIPSALELSVVRQCLRFSRFAVNPRELVEAIRSRI